jgi:hypothetical protein
VARRFATRIIAAELSANLPPPRVRIRALRRTLKARRIGRPHLQARLEIYPRKFRGSSYLMQVLTCRFLALAPSICHLDEPQY